MEGITIGKPQKKKKFRDEEAPQLMITFERSEYSVVEQLNKLPA